MSKVFKIVSHTVPGQHIREYPRATCNLQEAELKLAVKQYIPLDNQEPRPGDVTIIAAHANGFPKEMYEALFEDLHSQSKTHGFRIRGIWISDVAWQGKSGLINEAELGNDPSWFDHARDLMNLINIKRDEMPRPIIGMGHSFGANVLTNVALSHPRLLHSLVLIDPVISRFASTVEGPRRSPAALSYTRQDVWPSREAAMASFSKSKFYGAWDKRVLDAWCQHGVVSTPTRAIPTTTTTTTTKAAAAVAAAANTTTETNNNNSNSKPPGPNDGKVTLTTSMHQELFTFLRPTWPAYDAAGKTVIKPALAPDHPSGRPDDNEGMFYPFYRPEGALTYERLPNLRPSTLYVFGEASDVSPKMLRDQKVSTTGVGVGGSGGRDRGRVKEVLLPGVGHLIPMDVPDVCASHAAGWIGAELVRWRDEEKAWEAYRDLPHQEQVLVPDIWGVHLEKKRRRSNL